MATIGSTWLASTIRAATKGLLSDPTSPNIDVYIVTDMPTFLGGMVGADLASCINCSSPATMVGATWVDFLDTDGGLCARTDEPVIFTVSPDTPDQVAVGYVVCQTVDGHCIFGVLFDVPIPMSVLGQELSVTPRFKVGPIPLVDINFVV